MHNNALALGVAEGAEEKWRWRKMITIELIFSVPEDILYTLNETKYDFIKKMKLSTAIELYKLQKLSMGKASELKV